MIRVLLPLLAVVCCTNAEAALEVAQLRCEYRETPLGIDATQPRLSWIVSSAERGEKQTAYRVLVAASAEALANDRGDLWDSGKLESDETIAVVYAGKRLAPHVHCHWKVMVWDKAGKPSTWSKPALWTVGLTEPSQWQGEWIGLDLPRPEPKEDAPLDAASWIGHAADKFPDAPKGHRLYLSTWTVPDKIKIDRAELFVLGDDRYKVVINTRQAAGHEPDQHGWKSVRAIDITGHVKPGKNEIRVEVENAADGPSGLLMKLMIGDSEGSQYIHVTDGTWKSTDAPGANWHNREIDANKWPAVKVLGAFGMAPWGKAKLASLVLPAPRYLRTTIALNKPVKSATLYATALGNVDLHLNGQRVSDEYFTPGWTDYKKRVYYRAYDVTKQLQQGKNAWGAVLADGWYSGYIGWGRARDHYGKNPRFLGQLHVEFADGTTQTFATGNAWKAATGPILEADFLMGETYDAQRELSGWDTAEYSDEAWQPVAVGAELQPLVQAHPGPPVVAFEEFRAKNIAEPRPGVYVLDMGQNFAGVPRLTIKGEPGQKIQLRFAERLNPDGTIYTTNLRSARTIDTYICRGGNEVYQPRFTFHGFQYIEITGLKQRPTAETVVGVAISSATPVAGRFECSDPMRNRLHKNIYYTQRANFIDIPTDCPQRDERLGWTGDAQVYIRTATLNADVHAFFNKWLVDLEDGQRADGQFPMVAPVKVAGDDGGPAWADAGTICPWTVYQVYGDRQTLAKHYEAMKRFVAFNKSRCTEELLPPKQYHCFGDWLSIKADTPKEVIFTAYFAYSTKLTANAAAVLGKADEAAEYNALFDKIKAAFNKAYVAADGRIKGDTQAVYVLALAFDLVDGEKWEQAAKYLVANIEQREGHLSTGFIGTKDLMLVLAKIGRNDVAYRLLHNETFPSWGFSIKHGATSIWERWDGWTPERGFQDPGMNSFAHYSFGAVYQWMVENIGGIRSKGPAYKKIVIAPTLDGKLTWAKVRYESIRGPIASNWVVKGGKVLLLGVTIPANTTATIAIPTAEADVITENGNPLASAESVKVLSEGPEGVVLSVGSGSYRFEAPVKVK